MAKFSLLQLRACHKVRLHLSLQHHDRAKTNFDNELQETLAASSLEETGFESLKSTAQSLQNRSTTKNQKCTASLGTFNLQKRTTNLGIRMRNEKNNELEKNFDNKPYNFRSQLQQQLSTVTFTKKKENAANFYSAASKTKLQSRLGVQLLQDANSALRGQLMRPLQRASTEACQEYREFSLATRFRSRIDKQLPRKQLDRRDLQQDSF